MQGFARLLVERGVGQTGNGDLAGAIETPLGEFQPGLELGEMTAQPVEPLSQDLEVFGASNRYLRRKVAATHALDCVVDSANRL